MNSSKPELPSVSNRDRGGSFTINNPEDGSPIKEMFKLREGLLLITEKCTYRIQLADQIDPNRTNPALPHNVQQKLFDYGTNSELLCNTLLLARIMFRKECQPTLDINQAIGLAFDALIELASMDEAARAFSATAEAAVEKARESRLQRTVRLRCQRHRQKLRLALGEPLLRCRTLAFRAMPVAAAVIGNGRVRAVLAARDMAAESCGAAVLDGAHHLELAEAYVTGAGSTPASTEVAEDVRDFQSRAGHDRRRIMPAAGACFPSAV